MFICFIRLTSYRVILKEFYTLTMEGNEIVTSIKEIIPHPQYDGKTLRNDITILILEIPVVVSSYFILKNFGRVD